MFGDPAAAPVEEGRGQTPRPDNPTPEEESEFREFPQATLLAQAHSRVFSSLRPGRFDKPGKGPREIPPKLVSTVYIDLTPRQRAVYRRAEREGIIRLEALGRELRITHVLELILRLKQICNFCPESGESSKLIDLKERLSAASSAGEKALVFSQFVEEPFGARRLARELSAFSPLLLVGDTESATRASLIAEFDRNPKLAAMVLSLRAGGVGLNLTSASYVFHFDRWWNPAVGAQAEDRTYRIGQDRPVNVYSYVCSDTIEERIEEILSEKRAMFVDIIEAVDTGSLRRLDMDVLLDAVRQRRSFGCP